MKVREFIDWIRPIMAMNPETDLNLISLVDEFKISNLDSNYLHITDKEVTICFFSSISNSDK